MLEITVALKDKYMDLKGLSIYSALAVPTLRDYLREGRIPYFKIKGKILIKQSEFDKWMENHRVKRDLEKLADEAMAGLKR